MAAASATGWITPVSWLASERAANGAPCSLRQVFKRSQNQSRSATPSEETGHASVHSPLAVAVLRVESCSVIKTMGFLAPAAMALLMAMTLASVPPEVKVTASGAAPTKTATSLRACSTAARASRPLAWTDEGLPPISSAHSAASRASGRMGAVAL